MFFVVVVSCQWLNRKRKKETNKHKNLRRVAIVHSSFSCGCMTHNDNSEQMITFMFVSVPFFLVPLSLFYQSMCAFEKNVCTSFESKINLHIVRSSRINKRIKLNVCLYIYERYLSVGNFSLTVQQFIEGRIVNEETVRKCEKQQ